MGLFIGFGLILWYASSIPVPTSTDPANALVQPPQYLGPPIKNPYVSGYIYQLNNLTDNQSYCNGASDSNCDMIKQVDSHSIASEKTQCEKLQSIHDYIEKWGGSNFVYTLPSLQWTGGTNTCSQYQK